MVRLPILLPKKLSLSVKTLARNKTAKIQAGLTFIVDCKGYNNNREKITYFFVFALESMNPIQYWWIEWVGPSFSCDVPATAVASMRRTEALASVKFYQILSIFIFFIRLIILEDFIRLISYNGPCVRLSCSFFLATALPATMLVYQD